MWRVRELARYQSLAAGHGTLPSRLLGLRAGSLDALITDEALYTYTRGLELYQRAVHAEQREAKERERKRQEQD